jgi:hypothetical protein
MKPYSSRGAALAPALALALCLASGLPAWTEITKVYLLPFSHQDIGFTATQTEVAEKYHAVYEELPGVFDRTPGFTFTVETFWQFERWLDTKPSPEKLAWYVDQAKKGRLEFMAAYGSMHTGFQNAFSMAETFKPALDFGARQGIPIRTAMMNDLPGYSADLPDALADAGIKYFMTGVNQGLAKSNELQPRDWLFWWEGPKGRRVLSWVSQESYMEGVLIKTSSDLEATLRRLEKAGYPYDAIPLMVAGDNRGYAPGILAYQDLVKDAIWLKKGLTVEMSTPTAFFDHMAEKYGSTASVKRGDWSGWWDVLKNSGPYSAALARWTQNALGDLDRAGLLDRKSPAWIPLRTDLLTYMEHATHGTAGWPGLLNQAQVDDSNLKVIEYAERASAAATALIEGLIAKQRRFLDFGKLVAWNASGDSQPQPVAFASKSWREDRRPIVVVDGREYAAVPFRGEKSDPWRPFDRGYEFSAPLKPGFTTFTIARWEGYSPQALQGRAIESPFYRVEFDSAWNIVSVKDLGSGKTFGGPAFGAAFESFNPLVVRDSDLRPLARGSVKGVLTADSSGARALLTSEDSALARVSVELPSDRKELLVEYALAKKRLVYTPYKNHSRNYYIRFPLGQGWTYSYEGPASTVTKPYEFTRLRPSLLPAPGGVMLSREGLSLRFESREAFMANYFMQDGYLLYHLFRNYGQAATKDKGIVDMNEVEPGSPDLIKFGFSLTTGAGSPPRIPSYLSPAIVR